MGEREGRDEHFAWPDINDTAINRIDILKVIDIGPTAMGTRIHDTLNKVPEQRFCIHLDVDVVDQSIMPAVDCPAFPGLSADDLVTIVTPLAADSRYLGTTVTVFDPDLDPEGLYASIIVDIPAQLPFSPRPDG